MGSLKIGVQTACNTSPDFLEAQASLHGVYRCGDTRPARKIDLEPVSVYRVLVPPHHLTDRLVKDKVGMAIEPGLGLIDDDVGIPESHSRGREAPGEPRATFREPGANALHIARFAAAKGRPGVSSP